MTEELQLSPKEQQDASECLVKIVEHFRTPVSFLHYLSTLIWGSVKYVYLFLSPKSLSACFHPQAGDGPLNFLQGEIQMTKTCHSCGNVCNFLK